MSAAPAAPCPGIPSELLGLIRRAVTAWRDEPDRQGGTAANHLAVAIDTGALHVAYQPIVDLLDNRIVAVEALVRLEAPRIPEMEGAPQLIEVAEACGLINALGATVLARSCSQLAAWREHVAEQLQVHVNVSPIELRDLGYVDRLKRILRATGLPPDALVLEITETAALEREGVAQRTLVSLASFGIEIALDDFGTGFASLDLLATTPARTLKLDRSFIASVGGESNTAVRGRAAIVQAAIGLGRSLGLEIVAEGVETPDQARTLLAWGCQFGQGHLYSPAVDPADLDLSAASPRRRSPLTQAVPSGRPLSSESIDLALALATTCQATDRDGGARRGHAAGIAALIADALGGSRDQIEAAVLLAAVADAPERLSTLTPAGRTTNLAARDLVELLATPPVIGRHTPPGAVARTAWALAAAKAYGAAGYDPALLAAHPDPAVDRVLRETVDAWWDDPEATATQQGDLPTLAKRLRGRDDADQRLRALLGLARAIGTTGSLGDVLELTAEEARRALGAASISVSRWERDRGAIRTLVNAGDLADWEQARPDDEYYTFDEYPLLAQRMLEGDLTIESLGVNEGDAAGRALLRRTGKGSSAAVPIVVDDVVWGELFATTSIGQPSFTLADGPYLNAVASFVGIAIARTEDVERVASLAHEDPLTRLANRRHLEQHVNALLRDPRCDTPVTLAMVDVNGLKQVNDDYGHATGDKLLVGVGRTLERATDPGTETLVGRLGGDEFCIALTGDTEQALELLEHISQELPATPVLRPRLSMGIATSWKATETFGDLLARADAARHTAKRLGRPVVVDGRAIRADPGAATSTPPSPRAPQPAPPCA